MNRDRRRSTADGDESRYQRLTGEDDGEDGRESGLFLLGGLFVVAVRADDMLIVAYLFLHFSAVK